MNEVKSFLTSKTFWIAGVCPVAIAVIDAVTNGADWRQAVMAGLGAVSIILRRLTTGGIDFTLPKGK